MTTFGFKTDNDLQGLTPDQIHAETERTIRMIRETASDTAVRPFERYLHKIVTICIEYSEPNDILGSDQEMQDWMMWEGDYAGDGRKK